MFYPQSHFSSFPLQFSSVPIHPPYCSDVPRCRTAHRNVVRSQRKLTVLVAGLPPAHPSILSAYSHGCPAWWNLLADQAALYV
ncbi:hypothetical protein J6590_038345 [Homalodisca vitripennis]|nr:hypothetical protein J6590_038345 [Homalodisca vitripennis]